MQAVTEELAGGYDEPARLALLQAAAGYLDRLPAWVRALAPPRKRLHNSMRAKKSAGQGHHRDGS